MRCRSEPPPYDPQKAKQLLAEAGYPSGLDAGEFAAIPGFPTVAEAVVNDLNAVGIRVRLRPMERAAFYAAWQEKKLRGLFMTAVGNSGNAGSRVEAFIQSKGAYAYGGYPDIDELFQQQARERDAKQREALLYKIQQLTIDRVMFAPVMDLRALMGIGPRIAKHTITRHLDEPVAVLRGHRAQELSSVSQAGQQRRPRARLLSASCRRTPARGTAICGPLATCPTPHTRRGLGYNRRLFIDATWVASRKPRQVVVL